MAKDVKNTVSVGKITAQTAFDGFEGDEIFTDRPLMNASMYEALGADQLPIIGWLVSAEKLNLPKNALKRPDGKDYFEAFVIHLTKATNVLIEGELTAWAPGREVMVSSNNSIKALGGLLGKADMSEVCLIPTTVLDLGGGQRMQQYRMKVGKNTKKREGAFLIGGPSTVSALTEVLHAIENGTVAQAVTVP